MIIFTSNPYSIKNIYEINWRSNIYALFHHLRSKFPSTSNKTNTSWKQTYEVLELNLFPCKHTHPK